MSNPTELPDLDKLEALARAADTDFADSARFSTKLVLQLIALARRAKPEGEAPQAEKWQKLTEDSEMNFARLVDVVLTNGVYEYCRRVNQVDWTQVQDWRYAVPATPAATLSPLCGAQHAESGAQADALRIAKDLAMSMWRTHYKNEAPGFATFDDMPGVLSQIDSMVTGLTRKADLTDAWKARAIKAEKALAAQSQGAQEAQLSIGFANNEQGVHVSVMQQHGDGSAIVLHQGRVPAGDSLARFALAAKAEAPAPRVIGGQRWSKEAEITESQIAAQQAASPDAQSPAPGPREQFKKMAITHIGIHQDDFQLDATGNFKRPPIARFFEFWNAARNTAYDEGAHALRLLTDWRAKVQDKGYASIESPIDAAPSAPGTPEAPKKPAHGHRDDYYLLANGRRLGLEPISRVRNMPNWVLAMELFATGSTSAHQLCRDAGVDPDSTTTQRAAQLDGGQEGSGSNG